MNARGARPWLRLSFYYICTLLAACAGSGPVETVQPDAARAPLAYLQWARSASPEELQAERARLSAHAAPADPVIDAVQLGILLSLPEPAAPADAEAALRLLAPLAAAGVLAAPDEFTELSAVSREYAVFAGFLLAHLQQRADLRTAQASVAAQREELEALQHSNRQLQEKIDALTRIEEQLIEREQAQGAAP